MSPGWLRRVSSTDRAYSAVMPPKATKAYRQPIRDVSACDSGPMTLMPSPMPAKAKPMIVPRRLTNQRASSEACDTCPASPTPPPTMTPNSTIRCHNDCTRLHAARPTAMAPRPPTTTTRGPQRSVSAPTSGDDAACTTLPTEKAIAAPPRLQSNDSSMATKNTA